LRRRAARRNGCGDCRPDGGPDHCRQGQRRQAQGRLGAGHGLTPVPLDGLIGDAGRVWARYYFDTEILNRSFTVISVLWFFAYLISQGVSISFIALPSVWLLSTGVFLFFGCGFYVLNLLEIRRKQKAGVMPMEYPFLNWQRRRMVELLVLSLMAFAGAYLVLLNPAIALPAAIIALVMAIWQLVVTNDYRRHRFIETGI